MSRYSVGIIEKALLTTNLRIRDDLNYIFDSVFEDISKLVKGQVKAIVKKTGNVPEVAFITSIYSTASWIFS